MVGIHVTSEIKPLKKVLLHRPGKELLNLTPDTLGRLLFDDIPFLKVAQAEHDRFAEILRENGVEVVYLEDLMAEVLDADPAVRKEFLEQFIREAGIRTQLHCEKKKFKAKITYASKLQIPFVIFLGEDEVQSGNITYKNLSTGVQQTETPQAAIAAIQSELAQRNAGKPIQERA